MPKDKRKGRKDLPAALAAAQPDDDDNASINSDQTVSTQHMSDDDGISEEEKFEEKVREAMDLATEKSVQTRTNALISLRTAFQKKCLTGFLYDNYMTLTDLVERSLKKGKGLEQVAAAKLLSAFIISLINTDEFEEISKMVQGILTVLVQDPTASPVARQEVASTMALLSMFNCRETTELTFSLNCLHKVFSAAFPKGNGELPTHSPAVTALHTASLQGICLLLTLLPPNTVYTMAPKLLGELMSLLGSADVDLRVMVGEAIALIYEIVREDHPDFRWQKNQEIELVDKLTELVNDSHKYRGKKERKHQRMSFREVLKTVEDQGSFYETINIGPTRHQQEFEINGWQLRFQYQAVCHALDVGVNSHMTSNPQLREFFELGPPLVILSSSLGHKAQKKPNHETPAVKARSLARNKNRDNRAEDLSYDD